MGEIISIGQKREQPAEPERLIWVCSECNCSTFHLYDDDTSECALCGKMSENYGEWVRNLRAPSDTVTKTDNNTMRVTNYGCAEIAKRRVIKKIRPDDPDLVSVFAVWRDGTNTSWDGIETIEQRDFLADILRTHMEATQHRSITEQDDAAE